MIVMAKGRFIFVTMWMIVIDTFRCIPVPQWLCRHYRPPEKTLCVDVSLPALAAGYVSIRCDSREVHNCFWFVFIQTFGILLR